MIEPVCLMLQAVRISLMSHSNVLPSFNLDSSADVVSADGTVIVTTAVVLLGVTSLERGSSSKSTAVAGTFALLATAVRTAYLKVSCGLSLSISSAAAVFSLGLSSVSSLHEAVVGFAFLLAQSPVPQSWYCIPVMDSCNWTSVSSSLNPICSPTREP